MANNNRLAILALAGLLGGCAGSAGADRDYITLQMQPTRANAGNRATVTLVAEGEQTGLNFNISGLPAGIMWPVQLLTFIYPGSCDNLGAKPAYSLNTVVTTTRLATGWTMSRTAPASLASLRAAPHAVVLRTLPMDSDMDIFCVAIK